MLLDLKNRAHLLKYLEIPVEETPIIPYFDYRRYIFGSPRATVTLTGGDDHSLIETINNS